MCAHSIKMHTSCGKHSHLALSRIVLAAKSLLHFLVILLHMTTVKCKFLTKTEKGWVLASWFGSLGTMFFLDGRQRCPVGWLAQHSTIEEIGTPHCLDL